MSRSPHSALKAVRRSEIPAPRDAPRCSAFTLMEVMIACGIFFMATFTILALVSNSLRNARNLQRLEVDAGMAAAQVYQLLKTNRQEEGTLSGDFGNTYRDYSFDASWYPDPDLNTNTYSRVDIVVSRRGLDKPADTLSFQIFRPDVTGFGRPGR